MDQDKIQEEIVNKYKATIDAETERLKDTHTKNEFTFTITEKRRIAQQEAVGIIANQAISDIVNTTVLPRIGINADPNIKIIYDANVGRLTIFTPKETPKTETLSSTTPGIS